MADGALRVGGTNQYLETVTITTTAGTDLHREGVCVSDPTDAAGRQKVTNAAPSGTDYGAVVWVQNDPTAGYKISDIDDSGTPQYFGYLDRTGAWYIMRNDTGAYRYVKGSSGYTTAWTNRAAQSFDYFNQVF